MNTKSSLIVFFLSLCLHPIVKAQNINIPDANFKNLLLSISSIDDNKDDEISQAEAADYKGEINFQNAGISDLTGIEFFVNIPELRLDKNSLTTLDLSKNTKLVRVQVPDNDLTSIDVSGSPDLEVLWVNLNNLDRLDVSNNPALTELLANGNSLDSINLSNNPALLNLRIHDNQLGTLDLTQNPNIEEITAFYNNLKFMNLQNGANTRIKTLNAAANVGARDSVLRCIQVDDVAYFVQNRGTIFDIPKQAGFSRLCSTTDEPVAIWPNPTYGPMSIGSNFEFEAVKVYDMRGSLLLDIPMENNKIDMSALRPGEYLIQLQHIENRDPTVQRFIKY